jgi:hypothetical protein
MKPHLCETCGETNSENFYKDAKSTCKKCFCKKGYSREAEKKKLENKEKGVLSNLDKNTLYKEGKYICSCCNEIKTLDNFYSRDVINTIGVMGTCKECYSIKQKKRRPVKEAGTNWKMSLRESGTKLCPGCKEVKDFSHFGKSKSVIDGYQRLCKPCKSESDRRYREENQEKLNQNKRNYYHNIKTTEIYKVRYEIKKSKRDYKYEYDKMRSDDFRRYKDSLRKLVNESLRVRKGWVRKDTKTQDLLGADFKTIMTFIESQFVKGMSWNNHGEWHIDHVIPLAAAGRNKEHLYSLFNYRNLSPIWAEQNLAKGDKIPEICTLYQNPILPYKELEIWAAP